MTDRHPAFILIVCVLVAAILIVIGYTAQQKEDCEARGGVPTRNGCIDKGVFK